MENNKIELMFNQMNNRMRNRIDLFICEEAIKIFRKKGKFRTFTHWCDKLRLEINTLASVNNKSVWASKDTINIQAELIEKIIDIFGFNIDEAYYLISHFFYDKSYVEFEEVAKISIDLFYNSVEKVFNR
jgi:hypothetical protein